MLQCLVAMSWLNLSGLRQTRANVQHAGKPHGYWVLCTPAKTSKLGLKPSAGIRNPMLYPTELQAPGLLILCWQPIKIYPAIFTIFQTSRKQIRRGRRLGCAPVTRPRTLFDSSLHSYPRDPSKIDSALPNEPESNFLKPCCKSIIERWLHKK